jgi:excisionase family DNA binding protein
MPDMQPQRAAELKARPRRVAAPEPLAATIDDTCRITGLGKTSIYELIAQGKLKSVAIGRRRLVLMRSIEALLQPQAA